jgi:hypothetical protein
MAMRPYIYCIGNCFLGRMNTDYHDKPKRK